MNRYKLALRSVTLILTKWIFFNVGIALIPLLFTYTILGGGQDSFDGFLKHFAVKGEFLVLSTALIGEGISELLTSSIVSNFIRVVLGGICTLALIFACFLYANISTLSNLPQDKFAPDLSGDHLISINKVEQKKIDRAASLSQQLLLLSLITGASCKVIAALEPGTTEAQNNGGGQTGGTTIS